MSVNRQDLDRYFEGAEFIPLRSGEKRPLHTRWRMRKYTPDEIGKHVEQGCNVGVRISKDMMVVDVDPKHADARGASAAVLLSILELELGIDLTGYPTVKTGSGGMHVYMTYATEDRLREKLKSLGGSIEFKKYGKQVVAAGSIHPNGNYYQWVVGGELRPAPDALVDALRWPKPEAKAPDEVAVSPERISLCLDQLSPLDFRNYDDWRNLMFAAHEACGGDLAGLEAFTAWSTSDPKYRNAAGDIRTFWEHADDREEGRTAATLFWHVVQAGGSVPHGPPEDDFEALDGEDDEKYRPRWRTDKNGKIKAGIAHNVCEAIRFLGLPLAYDEFANRVMCGDKHLTDDVRNDVAMMISNQWGARWTGDVSDRTLQRGIVAVARKNRVHPIRDYLDSLEWDGRPRLETYLIEAAEAEDTPYVRAVSRTLLYAAVGRVYEPGVKFDVMVILEGPQGIGKSMLVRKLGGKYALEGLPPLRGPNDKDVIGSMLGNWLIEIEELASMRKADIDVLKSFITKTEDHIRLPYRENADTYPRQCVLIGTTNDAAYLRDMTGNRRFAPVAVGNIDLGKVDRDQLWAEATMEWKTKSQNPITLPPEVWGDATVEQEKRRIEDPWEDILREALEKSDDVVTTEAVFMDVMLKPYKDVTDFETKKLSRVMQRLGWKRCEFRANGVKRRGYRRTTPAGRKPL